MMKGSCVLRSVKVAPNVLRVTRKYMRKYCNNRKHIAIVRGD